MNNFRIEELSLYCDFYKLALFYTPPPKPEQYSSLQQF